MDSNDYQLYVISAGRPGNVPRMQALGVDPAIWVVPKEQVGEYKLYGATEIMGVRSTQVTHQRNAALDHAFAQSLKCVMIDDDLKTLRYICDGFPKGAVIDIHQGAQILETALIGKDAPRLAGAGPTNNAYFVKKPWQTQHFIRSGFVAVAPSAPRYDDVLKLKEDYDFTCQHLARYGKVARCDLMLATFQQRTNRGGCQSYRTPEEEERSVEYLLDKWPQWIKRHATRAHEVSLRYS